jgi:sec-independent protein translocase protein TatB
MNLFGIGTSEFILIFILALIFLGPQRLPQYVNKLGKKIREWRMMSQVFMVEWKEELAALEEARLSLAEARSALLEAQGIVATEVKGVANTVSAEVEGAQKDISAQLSDAEKAVSDETAQVRATMKKVKAGEVDAVAAETGNETVDTSGAESSADSVTAAAEGNDGSTVTAAVDDIGDGDDNFDVADVMELDEDDVADVVENTIAPPVVAKAKQTQTSQVIELDEIDVSEVQTVSDVASAVAEKIATEVATQVAQKVTKNMTSDMAEEVAALVMARLAEAGISKIETADEVSVNKLETLGSFPTPSESPELQEVVNE